ncbi:MAG: hypothetical protein WAV25_02770 [Minisyncoccia bacterium]
MKLWSKSSDDKTILVLDISSGSVGAGLIRLKSDSIPLILNTSRVPLYLSNKPNLESIEKALIKSVREAISNVGNMSVDKVLVSFSSPWIASRLRTYMEKSEKPFTVNQKLIRNVLEKEEEIFINDLSKRYIDESVMFDSKITSIALNGYESDLSSSQKTTDLKIQFMLYAGQKSLINKIEEEITSLIGVRDGLVLENFMFIFMKVFTKTFHNMHSVLLVNMSNEALDLLLIKESCPLVTISLPFGPAYMARAIQKEFNVPLEVAYSYISLFSDNVLDTKTKERIDNLFERIEAKWGESWNKVTSEIPKDQVIPYKIFLIGAAQNESIIKTLLSGTFDNHKVEQINKNSEFIKLITKFSDESRVDERLSILSAYSNLSF